jgi:hypothetical protein
MEAILDLIRRFLQWLLGFLFPQQLQQLELPPLKHVVQLPYRIAERAAFNRPDLPDDTFIALIPYDNGRGQTFELVASSGDQELLQKYCRETQISLVAQDSVGPAARHKLTTLERYADRFLTLVQEQLHWEPTRSVGALHERIAEDELNNRLNAVWTQLRDEVDAAKAANTLTADEATKILSHTETMLGRINHQRANPPTPPDQVNVRMNWINRAAGGERPYLLRFKIDPALTEIWQWGSLNVYWRGDISWASVSVSTSSGSVGVDMYCNGLWASGGSFATAARNAPSSFSLQIYGSSPNPNVYTMTGTWEAF